MSAFMTKDPNGTGSLKGFLGFVSVGVTFLESMKRASENTGKRLNSCTGRSQRAHQSDAALTTVLPCKTTQHLVKRLDNKGAAVLEKALLRASA